MTKLSGPHGLVPYGGGLYGPCECPTCMRAARRRTHPLDDPPDRPLDPPEPTEEELRQEKLRAEWEQRQKEDADD